jgi:hypothetical protein
MKQIEKIYGNEFGMAFFWKKDKSILADKIQLVFRETGFYLTPDEMQTFIHCIEDSSRRNSCCKDCEMKSNCEKFLLKTPCAQIDLAVSMEELKSIKDLICGSLFRINLKKHIEGLGRN